jgi:hypothetical protein
VAVRYVIGSTNGGSSIRVAPATATAIATRHRGEAGVPSGANRKITANPARVMLPLRADASQLTAMTTGAGPCPPPASTQYA